MKAVDWRHTLQLLNGVTHLPSQRATTLSAYSNQISVRTLLTPAYLVLPYHAYVFLSLHSTVVAACPDLGILGFSRPQQRPSNQLCQGGDTSNLQATQNRNHFVRRSKQRVGPAGLLENLPPTAPLSLSSVLLFSGTGYQMSGRRDRPLARLFTLLLLLGSLPRVWGVTATSTPSQSESATQQETPSQTPSSSQVATPSATSTESQATTPSVTSTGTGTWSQTQSGSESQSASLTQSATRSSSQGSTPSQTQTNSETRSASQTVTPTAVPFDGEAGVVTGGACAHSCPHTTSQPQSLPRSWWTRRCSARPSSPPP